MPCHAWIFFWFHGIQSLLQQPARLHMQVAKGAPSVPCRVCGPSARTEGNSRPTCARRQRKARQLQALRGLGLDAVSGAAFAAAAADFAALRSLTLVAPGLVPAPTPAWAGDDWRGTWGGGWGSPSRQRTDAEDGWGAPSSSSSGDPSSGSSSGSGTVSYGGGGGGGGQRRRSPARAAPSSPAQQACNRPASGVALHFLLLFIVFKDTISLRTGEV